MRLFEKSLQMQLFVRMARMLEPDTSSIFNTRPNTTNKHSKVVIWKPYGTATLAKVEVEVDAR